MTRKTEAQLLAAWHEQDPYDNFVDMLDSIPRIADEGTGYALWVSKSGNNTSGLGSRTMPYLTITKALSEVSADKKLVVVEQGTYKEAVTWPTRSGVVVVGLGRVIIDDPSSGGTATLKVAPGDPGGAWTGYCENIILDHNGTGLHISNTGGTSTLAFKMEDCEFIATGGNSIQTTNNGSAAINLEVSGEMHDIGGPVTLKGTLVAADSVIFNQMKLTGGLVSVNTDAGIEITFNHCEVKHEGVSGGHSGQKINAVFCTSRTGETIALLDTNDLAGSHTENIIGS